MPQSKNAMVKAELNFQSFSSCLFSTFSVSNWAISAILWHLFGSSAPSGTYKLLHNLLLCSTNLLYVFLVLYFYISPNKLVCLFLAQVVSLVGAQKASLHPDDMLLLANFILSSESFRYEDFCFSNRKLF